MTDNGKGTGAERTLPAAFVEEMRELFKILPGVSVSELPAFLESLTKERSYGLRRNPLKYTKEEFEKNMPYEMDRILWADEGYFYRREDQPGKSPYHEAGAFYIQEPSAMIAAELLGAEPGDVVADLCAAPGGKSTQIAGQMQGEGLLVCNEYVPARARILSQNLERMGVANCVVLKEDVGRMAERFPLFFDRVLVDAPCSGSGMFRKEEEALLQWSPENVGMCAERQMEILGHAAKMVRPGGVLVYSTCSFSESEDEGVVRRFLQEHGEFSPDDSVLTRELLDAGVCPGGLPGSVRMWPHRLCGEGHFAARFVKAGADTESGRGKINGTDTESGRGKTNGADTESDRTKTNGMDTKSCGEGMSGKSIASGKAKIRQAGGTKKGRPGDRDGQQENWNYFADFCKQYLNGHYPEKLEEEGRLIWRGEHLFLVPTCLPDLGNLRTERSGLYLGEAKKGRFEPSHTWAMTLKKEDVRQRMELRDPAVYLRGETVENEDGLKGWVLMLLQAKPLGWGKAGGNVVKNHYPKGLRKSIG